jgi:drug/metabolite transporter (DMT)-like permease
MSKLVRAHLSVSLVQILYSANFSIAKQIMPALVQPYGFIVLRVLPSALFFFAASYFVKKENILRGDLLRIVACAVTGVTVNQLLFFKGLNLTVPINGALIMTTNPILVMLFAALFLKEKISLIKVAGIFSGLTGAIALILFGKKFSFDSAGTLGDFYIFLNSVSFALFMIIAKPLMKKYHPLTITKWMFFFGSFMVLPFGFNDVNSIEWHQFTTASWLALAFVVVGVTFVAYLLNVIALRELSPAVVSGYIYLQPVFAALFTMIFAEGKPNLLHLICAVLIFTGVYLISKKDLKEKVKGEHRLTD